MIGAASMSGRQIYSVHLLIVIVLFIILLHNLYEVNVRTRSSSSQIMKVNCQNLFYFPGGAYFLNTKKEHELHEEIEMAKVSPISMQSMNSDDPKSDGDLCLLCKRRELEELLTFGKRV